jgi:hypothetical protein
MVVFSDKSDNIHAFSNPLVCCLSFRGLFNPFFSRLTLVAWLLSFFAQIQSFSLNSLILDVLLLKLFIKLFDDLKFCQYFINEALQEYL